jgi:hypothetical protein
MGLLAAIHLAIVHLGKRARRTDHAIVPSVLLRRVGVSRVRTAARIVARTSVIGAGFPAPVRRRRGHRGIAAVAVVRVTRIVLPVVAAIVAIAAGAAIAAVAGVRVVRVMLRVVAIAAGAAIPAVAVVRLMRIMLPVVAAIAALVPVALGRMAILVVVAPGACRGNTGGEDEGRDDGRNRCVDQKGLRALPKITESIVQQIQKLCWGDSQEWVMH